MVGYMRLHTWEREPCRSLVEDEERERFFMAAAVFR